MNTPITVLNTNSSKVGHIHDDLYLKKSLSRSDESCGAMQVRSGVDGNTNYHLNSGIYAVTPTSVGNPTGTYGVILTLNTSQKTGNDSGAWIKQMFFPNDQDGTFYIRENVNYAEGKWSRWKRFTGVST